MTVLASNDNESGSLASYAGTSGAPTMVAPPSPQAYSGSYVVACPIGAVNRVQTTFTSVTTVYVRVAVRINLTAPAVTTGSTSNLILLSNTGNTNDSGAIQLDINTNSTMALRLVNRPASFAVIGSTFAVSSDTWYIVELQTVVSTTVGVLEMRVDGIVRATGSGLNTIGASGATTVGRCDLTMGAANSATGTIYYDVLVIDDAAYPGLPATYTWEQEGYQWRRDDGTEVTATAIGAQDTPL